MPDSLDQARFDPHELTAERVRHLYRRRNAAWWTQAITGAFMAVVLWPSLGAWAALWYLFLLLAQGWQWHVGRFKVGGERLAVPMASVWPHRGAALLAGIAWGVLGAGLPWLLATQVPMVLVLVVLATVVSLPRMAAMPDVFLAYALGAMAPMTAAAACLPHDQARLVWMVVALVSVVLWVSARAAEADVLEVVVKRLNLERMAWEDKLTGLPNRRRFDAVLAQEWRRAARLKVPLTILLLDVDHFKAFNDRHGHPAGDACLTMVGGVLASTVRRAGDFAARYGGEEFVVLLFHTPLSDGLQMAEKIRQAVHALGVNHAGSSHQRLTVSVGGATVVPGPGLLPQTLVDQADEALYEAKAAGRDKVVWHRAL